ncbi:glycosyltransferase [Candidatus Auribacterota bacterium]
MERKETAIVGHVTEVYGPVQALKNYLERKKRDFLFVAVPFSYTTLERAYAEHYRSGEISKEIPGPRNPDIKKLYIPYYFRSALFTFFQVAGRKKKVGLYVGIDNLNAFIGLVLKKLGYVDEVAYYVIDYTKNRFILSFFNKIYHAVDRICVKHADYIWNISDRIADVRKEQGVPPNKNLVVNVGVELEKIRHCPDPEKDKNILAAVSHLTESKGIQLVIDTIAEVKEKVPAAKLHIIGTGPYESELKRMVKDKKVEDCVSFLGPMDHNTLFSYLPKCGIALATYTEDPDSITYYADPTKPKEYLACGLPIIITKVPWIAEEVEKRPMGVAIRYNKAELKDAIVKLMGDTAFYDECRKKALEFTSGLSWDGIYDKTFSKMNK